MARQIFHHFLTQHLSSQSYYGYPSLPKVYHFFDPGISSLHSDGNGWRQIVRAGSRVDQQHRRMPRKIIQFVLEGSICNDILQYVLQSRGLQDVTEKITERILPRNVIENAAKQATLNAGFVLDASKDVVQSFRIGGDAKVAEIIVMDLAPDLLREPFNSAYLLNLANERQNLARFRFALLGKLFRQVDVLP
ncbi:hypothetical protein CpipJ_CPIJ006117 [Culex quinquefasciatus]|uniref:Uncharacterized protein n=1 Tax=Culex quinquefasciatus TaxID=7176 RepID=B0WH16_CULQU|nr:hypothetical protein CpipJ_CPIJ006117 [Culex quinquefasciatus]|eukprot:XP_001848000.1 hypothetical protein CpipJ_CPIJ006117 [Culex quinquefasciatus]